MKKSSFPIGILPIYESFKNEVEYRDSNCLSYSIIKGLYDNPELLRTPKKQDDSEWLKFGTLVDLMLTTPKDYQVTNIIINDTIPSEQYKNICDYISLNNLNPDEVDESNIDEVFIKSGSKVNWGSKIKLQKFTDECLPYLNLLNKSKGKLLVSKSMYDEALNVANVFRYHRWTREFFPETPVNPGDTVEIYYKYRIKYSLEDLNFKSEIDLIKIDHEQKLISPYDIKTGTDSMRYFIRRALYDYGYGYQGALYKEGLKTFISKIPAFEGYEVDDFRFIYVSRLNPTYPVILRMNYAAHNEFFTQGIDTDQYFLPSILDITNATSNYLSEVDLGSEIIEPYDLWDTEGEVTIGTKEKRRGLVI